MEYVTEVSDGKIAVFFKCSEGEQKNIIDVMEKLGAESIKTAEAQQL
jgi:hypothetical protein